MTNEFLTYLGYASSAVGIAIGVWSKAYIVGALFALGAVGLAWAHSMAVAHGVEEEQ